MVVEKDLPGLRPPSPTLRHVFGDRRLSDLNPELQQFAMDAPGCGEAGSGTRPLPLSLPDTAPHASTDGIFGRDSDGEMPEKSQFYASQ
jgi:hypothetical protein